MSRPYNAASSATLKAFIARLHFYAGLLVGPFIFVAALTGTLYVLTPQIEAALYRDVLETSSTGPAQPLVAQAQAARDYVGNDPSLFAVRPAPGEGRTTRIMFRESGHGASESRAIFVDPATLEIKGDLVAYGTSGVLPFRTTIDYLHRNMLLGDAGRFYSELAASWLWLVALGGVIMWATRRTGERARRSPQNASLRIRYLHGGTGVILAIGLVFLSVTGLTWSQWAGSRITDLRTSFGWVTPSITTRLDAAAGAGSGVDHSHHHDTPAPASASGAMGDLDRVYEAAFAAGIDSPMIEIRPPAPGEAWRVSEIDRSWPTQVDTIALHPDTMAVTSRADFETFPLVAKLVRWGIDAHMGVLFGVPNQILMALIGIGLMTTIIYGYRIWWRNRPAPGTLTQSWLAMPVAWRGIAVLLGGAIGWALPLVGLSLLAFVSIDMARWNWVRRSMSPRPAE